MQIEGWAREGLTNEQIAGKMGIHRDTLNEWCKRFSGISDALKQGKAPVDIEVENMLLKRAMGFEYEEVTTEIEDIPTGKLDEKGNPIYRQRKHIKKTKKMVVPDTTAQIFWLKNRRPDKWRDKPMEAGVNDVEDLNPLVELLR